MATVPYQKLKLACYMGNVSMAAIGCLSPLLFVTFREMYGISYTLLGLLVVINFCTQLTVDLIFAYHASRFNVERTVKLTPLLTVAGLMIYGFLPTLVPQCAYLFLALGTVVFSAAAGLSEVLLSPVIAAIPSKTPERDMSILHSTYAWGLVVVVIFSTLFLKWVGAERWFLLPLVMVAIPAASFLLFLSEVLPPMEQGTETPEQGSRFPKGLWLCVFCIFLGGAAEGTMTQWISSYLESAVELTKAVGDILGMAMFSAALGLGRSLYAKLGKRVLSVIQWGMGGAAVCYVVAALSSNAVIGLVACVLTGLCVSMLWPGCLVVAEKRIPSGGVFMYAMMAAGGDLGASVAPQLLGAITDAAMLSSRVIALSARLGISAEQCGMRLGMLVGAAFPLLAAFLYRYLLKTAKNDAAL